MKEEYLTSDGSWDSLRQLKHSARRGTKYFATSNEEILRDREEIKAEYDIAVVSLEELNNLGG